MVAIKLVLVHICFCLSVYLIAGICQTMTLLQCECFKGDFVDEEWHCRPGSRREVTVVWTGATSEEFDLLWDGMAVEAL